MTTAPAPLRITPSLKHYAWGARSFIPEILGGEAGEEPVAEAWFGAHAAGPSLLDDGSGLDALLAASGDRWLGGHGELPFLVKFLAADRPLSIQVHPDARQAAAGFAREEAAGIARDAPERCYRDPHPKPELLMAMEPFEALCGFRGAEEIAAILARHASLAPLAEVFSPAGEGYRALVRRWFEFDEEQVRACQTALLASLERQPLLTASEQVCLDVVARWPSDLRSDRGLLFTMLLEHLHLEPGEAIFLRAGVPHAYLRGAGLEVMAASDNVLRAGLTEKHVAPQELLRIVRFAAGGWQRVTSREDAPGLRCWPTAATAFELRRIDVERVTGERRCDGPEIHLLLDGGPVTVESEGGTVMLDRGQACLTPAGATLRLAGRGDLACVSLPR